MRSNFRLFVALAGLLACVAATNAQADDITGAGSTFVYPVLSKWSAAYKAQTGIGINYQSIGSGGGIKQIEAKTVTFGASDMPLSTDELNKFGLLQFPLVNGGTVPVVNVKGIAPGQLVLDGPALADIYLGKITNWNDAAIKKLNPGMTLPNEAIAVVHRSDGSGTTFIFTNFLSKISPEWSMKVGASTAVEWPVGLGGKGNEGVAANVGQTDGSIGYVEYAYAQENHLSYARMVNAAGKVVSPDLASFSAAAAGADWAKADNFNLILTNAPGAASWPIAGSTWAIMYKQPPDKAATAQALKFFKWAYSNGKDAAKDLNYVAMPDNVSSLIETSWKNVQGVTP